MEDKKEVVSILLEDIIPNRFQPRLAFDEQELNSLAASIKQHGVLQPLLLRKIGDKYEIIAGERRYKAATIAGLTSVPAIIMETDDNTSAELAVVENVQRKDLNSMEEAQSYKKLADRGLTQEDIAKKIGVNQSTVANKIRLLSLDEEVQDALLNNKISERHARSLLAITDPMLQIKMLNKIIVNRLTVKQTEEEIAKMLGKSVAPSPQKQTEIINLDDGKMNLDMLLKPQTGPVNNENNSFTESLNTTPSTSQINPFQDVTEEMPINDMPEPIVEETSVEKFTPSISENIVAPNEFNKTDTTEVLDFDIQDELENPAAAPITDTTPINPLVEEFRQQKQEGTLPVIDAAQPTKSLSTAINSARDLSRDLNSQGYIVDIEEFDFEDMYQVVFKIQKD